LTKRTINAIKLLHTCHLFILSLDKKSVKHDPTFGLFSALVYIKPAEFEFG